MTDNEDVRIKIITLDLEKTNSKENLHQLLKEKLGFPEYYGMNWSAFWDTITGLVELPEKIVFF